jgi:hypothetical protein
MRTMSVKCAECQCTPRECLNFSANQLCQNCSKEICCCISIHHTSLNLNPMDYSSCCSNDESCNNERNNSGIVISPRTTTNGNSISRFLRYVKRLYAAALGIEILCIAAAEIGENISLYILGFNHIGLPIAYVIGYSLATFTTFATILGRYKYGSSNSNIDSCCSVLEQDHKNGFISNVVITFKNFGLGLRKMKELPKQSNLGQILKTSIVILITAETACIITAETVDLIFYKHAIYLSIPLALVAGAFTVAASEAYRKMKPRVN